MGKVYEESFRRQAVELYLLGDDVSYAQVAQDMGCSAEAVRAWVKQHKVDEGEAEGLSSEEKAELEQLRRDKLRLKKEVRILKAATAYFANDQQ